MHGPLVWLMPLATFSYWGNFQVYVSSPPDCIQPPFSWASTRLMSSCVVSEDCFCHRFLTVFSDVLISHQHLVLDVVERLLHIPMDFFVFCESWSTWAIGQGRDCKPHFICSRTFISHRRHFSDLPPLNRRSINSCSGIERCLTHPNWHTNQAFWR